MEFFKCDLLDITAYRICIGIHEASTVGKSSFRKIDAFYGLESNSFVSFVIR